MSERSASRRYGRLDDARLAALVRKGDDAARSRRSTSATTRRCCPSAATCSAASRTARTRCSRPSCGRTARCATGRPPDAMRPWLFAIARNRCRTAAGGAARVRRARPRTSSPASTASPRTSGAAPTCASSWATSRACPTTSARRSCCSSWADLSQAEIASVLGVPAGEGQGARVPGALGADRRARRALDAVRGRSASSSPCARGGVLRRGPLRRHLRQCAPCDAYRLAVARQRDVASRSLLPVLPTAGLKGSGARRGRPVGRRRDSPPRRPAARPRSAASRPAAVPLRPAASRSRRSWPRSP